MLSESEIERVCQSVRRGAKLMVGRDHSGKRKIKLIKGPFGLFVQRYQCTDSDLQQIQAKLQPRQAH